MAELKVGDVVQLKSGGPHLTIYQVEAEIAYCIWFSDNIGISTMKLPLSVLILPVE